MTTWRSKRAAVTSGVKFSKNMLENVFTMGIYHFLDTSFLGHPVLYHNIIISKIFFLFIVLTIFADIYRWNEKFEIIKTY